MFRIAVVEDEDIYVSQLTEYLKNMKKRQERRLRSQYIAMVMG